MEINQTKVQNWLKLFKLPLLNEGFHASGHANGQEILDMIRDINPEKVYPVHTIYKNKFDILNDDRIKVIHPTKSLTNNYKSIRKSFIN